MARYCKICSKKLSFFSGGDVCKECWLARKTEKAKQKTELPTELSNIQEEIIETKEAKDKHSQNH